MTISNRFVFVAVLALAGAWPGRAQEWSRFRGPNGTGISPAGGFPVSWTEGDYLWRQPIAGASHSQPVIWGRRLFLLTATDDSRERTLLCLDKTDGRQLWARSYPLPTHRPNNKNSGFANSSPVVAEERVFACMVSEEHFWVRAFTHEGKELWSRDLGRFASQHGHGASPMLVEGALIVTNDQDGESLVIAFDPATGRELWKAPRRPGRNPNVATAYSTPIVHARADGTAELLLTSESHGVSSLDARTGAPLWEAPVFEKRMVASAVVAGELVIGTCGSGGGGNYLSAVRLGGRGDVAKTHVAYTLRTATPYVPTPLYHDGRLYLISDAGIASAVEAATGRILWSERLNALFFSSPVLAEGRIYVPTTKGEMIVLAAGDQFKELARNPLGEGTHSTPCLEGGRLYIKTFTHLVCVGGK